MITKRHHTYLTIVILFSFSYIQSFSQEMAEIDYDNEPQQIITPDTTRILQINESDLDHILNLKSLLEKENSTYSKPTRISNRLQRQMRKDRLEMSDEAIYWARRRLDPSEVIPPYLGFRDTVIVNSIFLPLMFKPDSTEEVFLSRENEFTFWEKPKPEYRRRHRRKSPAVDIDTTFFEDIKRKKEIRRSAYRHVEKKRPDLFRYSLSDLPSDKIELIAIEKEVSRDLPPLIIEAEPVVTEIAPPAKFIPDRLYWTSAFQSEVKFSQNYISPNWHKGGNSNINLYTYNLMNYNYSKEKVNWTNTLDIKESFYNAQKDTLRNYRIGEDLFRVKSNFGYSAFSKWFYSFDFEFRTQFFTTFQENTEQKLAAFLAPFTTTLGVGMRYSLNKEFQKKGKNVNLNVNLAPLSYKYMYSRKKHDEIDLGRHGFQKNPETDEFEHTLSIFGSNVSANVTFNFSPTVSWVSRFDYFTSYDKVQLEFENTLYLAISRFFSTTINLNVRFDDSVQKNEEFDSYFQFNQLLSFGFNYKW